MIVEFLRGTGPDARGRLLGDLWSLTLVELERRHDYIQWLFPMEMASRAVPNSPVISAAEIAALAADARARGNMLRSLDVMLGFYGLDRKVHGQETIIVRAPAFADRTLVWLTPGNHNFLRLTRMMRSLRLLTLSAEANALFNCLAQVYREHEDAIGPVTFGYWCGAIRNPAEAGPGDEGPAAHAEPAAAIANGGAGLQTPRCPAAPEALRLAMDTGHLVPLIGAGLSRAVWLDDRERLPDALELAQNLYAVARKELPVDVDDRPGWRDVDRELALRRPMSSIAELLGLFPNDADPANRGRKNRWLREVLSPAAAVKPSSHHTMLNMLPFPFFLTLNYDRILEQVLEPPPEVVTFKEASLIPMFLDADDPRQRRFIFKLHGDITRVHEVVEALEKGTEKARYDPEVAAVLARICRENSLLFLGCSFSNFENDGLLDVLARSGREHFALVPYDEMKRLESSDIGRRYRAARVRFLAYLQDQEHTQVWEFLTQIAPSQRFEVVGGQTRQAFFLEEQRPDYLAQQLDIEARARALRYMTPQMTNALATETYIDVICRRNLVQVRQRGELPPTCDFEVWQDRVCEMMKARRRQLVRLLLEEGCEVRVLCERKVCEEEIAARDPIVLDRYRELLQLVKEADLEIRLANKPFRDRKIQSFASMLARTDEDAPTDIATAFAAQATVDPVHHMVVHMVHFNTRFAESSLVTFEREWVRALNEEISISILERALRA